MHKAGNIVFALTFYRDNIAPLTNGDNRLPKKFGISRRGNHFLKAVPDFAGLNAHMAANISQFRGSRISDFFLRQNRAEDFVFQIFVGRQCLEQRIQNRFFIIFGNISLCRSGAAKDARNAKQFFGLQRSAPLRPLQRGGDIRHIPKNRISLSGTQIGGGGGLLKQQLHFLKIRYRGKPQAGLLAAYTAGAGR